MTNSNKLADTLPNERGFEQWYVENAFDYERDPIGSRDCRLMRKAWHAALAANPAPAADHAESKRCDMCGFVGIEDPVIGCTRCGFDEMRPIEHPAPAHVQVDNSSLDNSREGFVTVPRHKLLDLLDNNLAAANIALAIGGCIDGIEARGGAEADDDMDCIAYHLYYGLHPAKELRELAESTRPPAPAADGAGELDAVAKAIADVIGHGMREKCIEHARAAIAALRQPVPDAVRESDKLVEFFRNEGYLPFGLEGDNMGWTPAETAIAAMRKIIASQQESRK